MSDRFLGASVVDWVMQGQESSQGQPLGACEHWYGLTRT
jgi:hypothetical protein